MWIELVCHNVLAGLSDAVCGAVSIELVCHNVLAGLSDVMCGAITLCVGQPTMWNCECLLGRMWITW